MKNKELAKHIKYRTGYKYQLAERYQIRIDIKPEEPIITEFINLDVNGLLTLEQGYASDGPSGITIDTKNSMRGAFVHDALYQLMRQGLLSKDHRPYIDELMRSIFLEDGMSKFRSWIWFRCVRGMAGFAADPENRKKIIVAPKG